MKRDDVAMRDAALLESALKYHPKGKLSIVCGVILEEGDASNRINRRVREDEIHAMALEIARGR